MIPLLVDLGLPRELLVGAGLAEDVAAGGLEGEPLHAPALVDVDVGVGARRLGQVEVQADRHRRLAVGPDDEAARPGELPLQVVVLVEHAPARGVAHRDGAVADVLVAGAGEAAGRGEEAGGAEQRDGARPGGGRAGRGARRILPHARRDRGDASAGRSSAPRL